MTADVRRRVDGLYFYPVKSCRGTSLDAAEVGPRGIVADRQWMIVDEKREFLSQRELPRLALVSPRLVDDILEISAPGMPLLTVSPTAGRDRTDVTV